MDSFSSTSQSPATDSQPSQILREVLLVARDVPKDTPANDLDSYMDDDSPPSGSRKAAPHYHYHGLAATQTQSQFDDSHSHASQKGSTAAFVEDTVPPHDNQILSFSSKNSFDINDTSRPAYLPNVPSPSRVSKTTKAVSFLSPRTTVTTNQVKIKQSPFLQVSPYRRSLSPASQDSFAEPPFRRDPEQEFLAVSKQFAVPLSELGTSPEDSILSRDVASDTKVQNTHVSLTRSQSLDESRNRQPDPSTDFQMSNSQLAEPGQGDTDYDDYIVNNHNRDVFIERDSQFDLQLEQSPRPSTSSEDLCSEAPTEIIEEPTQIVGESTQPAEEPTQVVEHQMQPTRPSEERLMQQPFSPVAPSVGAPISATMVSSNASTNPRSLYHMANVKRRLRLQGIVVPPSALQMRMEPAQRTNQSVAEHEAISPHVPNVNRTTITGENIPQIATIPSPVLASKLQPSADNRNDNTDIVPDSEPPRADSESSERQTNRPQQIALAAAPEVENEMGSNTLSENISLPAQLSLVSEDERDDIPLAVIMSKSRNIRRAIYTENSDSGSDRSTNVEDHAKKHLEHHPLPASKRRKLDISATPALRPTRSRQAQDPPPPALAKAKSKRSNSKGKGKKKVTESIADSTANRRHTPACIEDDARTEPINEDCVDTCSRPEDVGPSKKRKRAGSAAKKAPMTILKTSIADSITPLTRSSRKLRSAPGSHQEKGMKPTRVLARWSFSGHYYSGTVHSRSSAHGNCYIVRFDDDTECDVEIVNLRRCEFMAGDTVYLMDHGQTAVVVATAKSEQDATVSVEIAGTRLDVAESAIRVSESEIEEQWSRRALQAGSIVPFLQAQALKASPSRSSIRGTSSARFFKHVGFVVTLSLGDDEWLGERDKLVKMIEGKGGMVIADWSSIFQLGGELHRSKRWCADQEHIEYQKLGGHNDIRSVFLLSNQPNQKPKYLIALALGIPCVHINWVKHSVAENTLLDWPVYLLAAGHCASLAAHASQRIDLKWGDKTPHLIDIQSNSLASKPFRGKSVICVGSDTFPQKSFKRQTTSSSDQDTKHKEASRSVPRIALAMGARRVEAVCEPKHASANLSEFDYVIVKEENEVGKFARDGVICVHVPWMKDCLIASQLLPVPSQSDLSEEEGDL